MEKYQKWKRDPAPERRDTASERRDRQDPEHGNQNSPGLEEKKNPVPIRPPNQPEWADPSRYEIVKIKELDLEMIGPSSENPKQLDRGCNKIIITGKPGTGKTTIISSLIYAKKHLIPVGMVMSGTEDSNGFYRKMFPSTFVYNGYNEEKINDFIRRQKMAKQHLENPWALLLLDDCTDRPQIFRSQTQLWMFKNLRQISVGLYLVSLQYALDMPPAVRTNVDGIFILREPILRNRKMLYENYAGVIPSFQLFCDLMDQITTDYTALYIHNCSKTNDWRECVYWYRATKPPEDFKFGCKEFWDFHEERYNPEYVDIL